MTTDAPTRRAPLLASTGGPPRPPAGLARAGLSGNADEPFRLGEILVDDDGDPCMVSERPDSGSSMILVYYNLPHCKGEFEMPRSSLSRKEPNA